MGDGKAKSVIDYLDNLIEKGKASGGAIRPLKVAFSRVMQVIDGAQWEQTEVKSIDVDDYMSRFANLTMGKYTTESLTAYKSRFNRALGWYIQFLDKPGWTPDVQTRNRTAKLEPKKPKAISESSKNITVTTAAAEPLRPVQQIPNASYITYPFPLSDGKLVQISLPIKLSKKDAKRIGVFIESIAIEEQLTLGGGNE